jgi:hypothetical protein
VEHASELGVIKVAGAAMAGELDDEAQDIAGQCRIRSRRELGRKSVFQQDRDQSFMLSQRGRADRCLFDQQRRNVSVTAQYVEHGQRALGVGHRAMGRAGSGIRAMA